MADLLTPATVRAAATVRLADHLAEGPRTAAEVAEVARLDPDVTRALLAHLADLAVVEVVGDADADAPTYGLTELGRPLRSDVADSVRPLLDNESMVGRGGLFLMHLDHTLRTGEPGHAAEGAGYWETVNRDGGYHDEWAQMAAAMAQMPAGQLPWGGGLIVDEYDWSQVGSVVDVGGHVGVVLRAVLQAHPHLTGKLVDLPHAAENAATVLASSEVADRATTVVGSFFDELPAGSDVYLLSAILADWADADAIRILRRCAEAAGPTGRVLLAEVNMPVGSAAEELTMRSIMPAPVRSGPELVALAAAAGLTLTWTGPDDGVRSLLEFRAAPPEQEVSRG